MLAFYLAACRTPKAITTVSKCSWGWTQKASETCRALLQLLINILPSFITLVLYIYYLLVSYVIETFPFSFLLILYVSFLEPSHLCGHLFIFLLGRPSLRPVFGCHHHNFLETFPFSFPLILHVLCSDSSQLFIHLFIFLLGRPSFYLVFVCQHHNFLVPRKSSMFVSFLFLQLFFTTLVFNCFLSSFIVLPDNQNATSGFRNYISDVCNICVLVNSAIRSPQPPFQILHLWRHIRNFAVIKPNSYLNTQVYI